MKIREPKLKVGDKVRDIEDGDIYTVESINSYRFMQDEYWYNISDHLCVIPESALELYANKSKTVWDLKSGDKFYFVTVVGHIFSGTWNNLNAQIENRKLGNVFLTKEEAEFELERRKIEAKMISLGGTRKINELNSNVVHIIQMHFGLKYVYVRSFDIKQAPIGVIFFNYRKQAIKALETIGESKIKKYLFGVDE